MSFSTFFPWLMKLGSMPKLNKLESRLNPQGEQVEKLQSSALQRVRPFAGATFG